MGISFFGCSRSLSAPSQATISARYLSGLNFCPRLLVLAGLVALVPIPRSCTVSWSESYKCLDVCCCSLPSSSSRLSSFPSLLASLPLLPLSRDGLFLCFHGPCDRCSVPLRWCRCRRSPLVFCSFGYIRPTDPKATAKRQNTTTTSYSNLPDLQTIVQALVSNLGGTVGGTGALKVNATFGLGNQSESNPLDAIFQQLIPIAFNGLTGPGNSMNLTGVPGLPPFFIGLDFSPANGTAPGGFDPASVFSQISVPFSELLSTLLGGSNITTFPMFGGSFPDAGFPTIPGQNSTFPDVNGTTLPSSSIPSVSARDLPLPALIPADLPLWHIPSDIVSNVGNGLSSIGLPLPIPSGIPSSIGSELPSIASGIPGVLPSISPPLSSVLPLPTDISTPAAPLPTYSSGTDLVPPAKADS